MKLYKYDLTDQTADIMANILDSYGIKYRIKNVTYNLNTLSYEAPYTFIDVLDKETKVQLRKLKKAKVNVTRLESCYGINIDEVLVNGNKIEYPLEERLKETRKKLTDDEVMQKYSSSPNRQAVLNQLKSIGVSPEALPSIIRNQSKIKKQLTPHTKDILRQAYADEKYLLITVKHSKRFFKTLIGGLSDNTIVAIGEHSIMPLEETNM